MRKSSANRDVRVVIFLETGEQQSIHCPAHQADQTVREVKGRPGVVKVDTQPHRSRDRSRRGEGCRRLSLERATM